MAACGNRKAVGTSGAPLSDTSAPIMHGLRVKNAGAAGVIYIGWEGVTTSTGYPLGPGESEMFPAVWCGYDAANVYAVGSGVGLSAAFVGW